MTLAGVVRRAREPLMSWWLRRVPSFTRIEIYKEMHAAGKFCGMEWERHTAALSGLIPHLDQRLILDFGCGPLGGLATLKHLRVIPFDPGIPKYAELPWDQRFEVFFSVDVFEHLAYADLHPLFERLKQHSPRYIYLCISTRKALLRLSNGANAHLTVRPAHWWRQQLTAALPQHAVLYYKENPERLEFVLVLESISPQ